MHYFLVMFVHYFYHNAKLKFGRWNYEMNPVISNVARWITSIRMFKQKCRPIKYWLLRLPKLSEMNSPRCEESIQWMFPCWEYLHCFHNVTNGNECSEGSEGKSWKSFFLNIVPTFDISQWFYPQRWGMNWVDVDDWKVWLIMIYRCNKRMSHSRKNGRFSSHRIPHPKKEKKWAQEEDIARTGWINEWTGL